MKIKLNRDPKQLELIKLAGSKNREVSSQAMEILAGFIGPILQQVIYKAGTSDVIYSKLTFDQDTLPTIPLDFYIDKKVDFVRTWSSSIPGGLPTNFISGLTELKVSTYGIDSAVSFLKRYARLGQLDHVARALKWMAQELLVKTEINAWTPVLAALANASTNNLAHVIASTTAGVLQLDDFSRLITRSKKINAAGIDGGTPNGYYKGVTDMFLSPEAMEQIRGWVYQPLNTRVGASIATANGTAAVGIAAPDSMREEIYRQAGSAEVFGIQLHEVYELSPEGPYGVIFDAYFSGSFVAGTNNLVVGVDLSREALIETVEVDGNGGEVRVYNDDQFTIRSEKIGFAAEKNLGNVVLDDRALTGLTY